MISRKVYSIIVASTLSLVLFLSVVAMLLQLPVVILPYETLKFFLLMFIFIYEVASAKGALRVISICFLPFIFLGYIFKVMHWPFGGSILAISLSGCILALILSAFQSAVSRNDKLITLSLPLAHVLYLLTPKNEWRFIAFIIYCAVMIFVCVALWIRAFRKPAATGQNVL
jgi:hypothetical protein